VAIAQLGPRSRDEFDVRPNKAVKRTWKPVKASTPTPTQPAGRAPEPVDSFA
jgi:hypothetical protein